MLLPILAVRSSNCELQHIPMRTYLYRFWFNITGDNDLWYNKDGRLGNLTNTHETCISEKEHMSNERHSSTTRKQLSTSSLRIYNRQSEKGYSTGVVDAHKHSNTAHDTGPLPLKFVWFPKMAVQTGVEKTNHSWRRTKRKCIHDYNFIKILASHVPILHSTHLSSDHFI